jgi:hypothetical protein
MLISLGSGTLANLPNQAKLLGKLRGRSDQKLAEKRNFFFWKLTVDSDEGSWCRGLTCLPVTEEIAGSVDAAAKIKRSLLVFIEQRGKSRIGGDIRSNINIFLKSYLAGSWCRGLTCLPVTEEIAGSNPVGPAR